MIALYLVITLFCFVYYVKWRQSYWRKRGVSELKHEFFFGNARKILTKQISFGETFLERYKLVKDMGVKYAGMYAFLSPICIVIDPDLIKAMLAKDFSYFMGHGLFHHPKDILSMNLFSVDGEMWRNLRQKLTPTFTSGKMKMMFETLVEKTDGLERTVNRYADNHETFAIKEVLARFTTDIIGSCAFGIECNSMDDPENAFRKYGKKIFEPNVIRFWLISLFPWWLLGYLGFKSNGTEVTEFFTKLVKDTIKYREVNQIYRKDFMHLLLQLKNQGIVSGSNNVRDQNNDQKGIINENEIVAQCFIFFLAGFETSSSTMTFTLLELSRNPDIQEKLRNEINRVLEKYDGKVTYDAVMEMSYLDKVINETLRLFPPVPALPRVCTKDYKIPETNILIEKGTRVHIPVWGIHTDPEFYPNPNTFNPENFSEESKAKRPDFTFLPFGEGPRQCIGLRFGMLQSKVGLISLLRKFRFSLNSKTKEPLKMESGSFILAVKGEVWLDVSKV